jgi:hypothetical protein
VWALRGAEYEEKDNFSLTSKDMKNLQTGNISDIAKNIFFDRKILDEAASITVVNSSQVSGVGSTLASYIANLGATVIDVETGEHIEEGGLLVVRNKKSDITKRLKSLIGFREKEASEQEDFSGDLLILIGEDAARELTLP